MVERRGWERTGRREGREGREGKGREGKGEKGKDGKGREGKRRERRERTEREEKGREGWEGKGREGREGTGSEGQGEISPPPPPPLPCRAARDLTIHIDVVEAIVCHNINDKIKETARACAPASLFYATESNYSLSVPDGL
jgi:hypothetical protein